ncbi:MAG: hypothetical protein CVU54_10105 [Deltaproteobacteria bacterium HGW-Deltaproteobacteria-12]|jgi:hypothetical protein|nr:MAG: hypothetical protein CVU54_10105 [Deltaproteobacteria bacterium HGW-Deltaproteobacteria-12]
MVIKNNRVKIGKCFELIGTEQSAFPLSFKDEFFSAKRFYLCGAFSADGRKYLNTNLHQIHI